MCFFVLKILSKGRGGDKIALFFSSFFLLLWNGGHLILTHFNFSFFYHIRFTRPTVGQQMERGFLERSKEKRKRKKPATTTATKTATLPNSGKRERKLKN